MTVTVLTGRALFRKVAPMLERAHRERIAEMRVEAVQRSVARDILQAAEYRVAHREMHYVRNLNRGRRYVQKRLRLLEEARVQLAKAREHAERIGAVNVRSRAA